MMQFIRQIRKVRDRTLVIQLPDDFPAEDVEVIVVPVSESDTSVWVATDETSHLLTAIARFLTRDTSHLTETERRAYNHLRDVLKQGRHSHEPPILGLFADLVEIADDFEAPLPDEDLFWGQQTDEYGIAKNQ